MDPAIFTLIDKGLTLLPLLIQAGEGITNTVGNLRKLSQAGAAGIPVSDADLAAIEKQFDDDLTDFNTPMT